ncbi:MAG: PilZ domain-containing protein [Deltaproteobacteria bacterium]|nr:PilZ domain-containing protein [Deltaproteobacteria bacterium]
MERRAFTRVPFDCQAELAGGALRVSGPVTDLSLFGLRLLVDAPVPLGSQVVVHIVLSAPMDLSFDVDGVVARGGDGYVGVRFTTGKMDVEALEHLRLLVGTVAGDLDEVMDEFYAWLNSEG